MYCRRFSICIGKLPTATAVVVIVIATSLPWQIWFGPARGGPGQCLHDPQGSVGAHAGAVVIITPVTGGSQAGRTDPVLIRLAREHIGALRLAQRDVEIPGAAMYVTIPFLNLDGLKKEDEQYET